ncbi:hypothetical protein ACOSP6_01280 [Tenacibaculum sp. MEBiC06402]|uniref:hypothetical protein n=1 Tax=unclassified Tenacibaculum TaxID=2635139 RepID=UPI003B9BE29F
MRNIKLLLLTFVLVLTIGCTDNTENLVTDTTQNTEITNTENINAFDTGGQDGNGNDGGGKDGGKG